MAIQKEIWTDYIVKNLWKNNDFLLQSADESQYVLAGKVVHIPNAGNAPSVKKNRTTLPAVVTKRSDSDVTYNLNEYTSDPVLIENADKIELSYDKISSVMEDIMMGIRETMVNWMLYDWVSNLTLSTTVNLRRFSGAASGTTYNYAPDQTGNLKYLTPDDVKAAQKLMDKAGVPQEDRFILIDADSYDHFTNDLKATTNRDFVQYFDAATGVVGKLYGFTFYKRSTVLYADSTSTPVVQTPDATSGRINGVAIAWQKQMVARAIGNVDFFENVKDATYYGDVYSGLLRAGGRNRKADHKGLVLLIQGA